MGVWPRMAATVQCDEVLAVPFGGEEAGADSIHPHALGTPFTAKVLGQINNPCFATE